MRAFRRHIAILTAVWLLSQGAVITATPLAVCEFTLAGGPELSECCRNLTPAVPRPQLLACATLPEPPPPRA